MPADFTRSHVWDGGDVQLDLTFGSISDEEFIDSLVALWSHSSLRGPFFDSNRDTEFQAIARLSDSIAPFNRTLYGLGRCPNGVTIPCRSYGGRFTDQTCFLSFGLPMGALSLAYQVGAYPFDDHLPGTWRFPVIEWLRDLGVTVFAVAQYVIGHIGHEVAIDALGESIGDAPTAAGDRSVGYLVPENGQLRWYPPLTDERLQFSRRNVE